MGPVEIPAWQEPSPATALGAATKLDQETQNQPKRVRKQAAVSLRWQHCSDTLPVLNGFRI